MYILINSFGTTAVGQAEQIRQAACYLIRCKPGCVLCRETHSCKSKGEALPESYPINLVSGFSALAWLPLAARLGLAGVFTTAGVAKLADRPAAARSFVEFGVPGSLASVVVSLLAITEVVCAVAVLPSATARFGALGIATLLTLFIGVILWTLARGRRPACACFGQVRSEPIGPKVLVRNSVLWAAAAFVAMDAAPRAAGQPPAATWADAGQVASSASVASLLAVVSLVGLVALAVAFLTVLRNYGKVLLRVERLERQLGIDPDEQPAGLPIGTPAPSFMLTTLDGATVSLADVFARVTSVVLVFVEPGCGPCTDLLPHLADAQRRALPVLGGDGALATAATGSAPLAGTAVVVVSQGTASENRAKIGSLPLQDVLLQHERDAAAAYVVVGTPSAVRITNGLVASVLAAGPEPVRDLLNNALVPADDARLGPGDEVPAVTLADLDGRPVNLRDFARSRTLLLFWSPACGYCEQMLAQLKAWERSADAADTRLLVVSQGSASSNREQGLKSTVLLDDTFTVGQAFAAGGTPSAVVLDAGRVASDVGVGAAAVFALAAPRRVLVTQS